VFFCCLLVFFSVAPRKRLNSAIFQSFLLLFGLFFVALTLGIFSADALGQEMDKCVKAKSFFLPFRHKYIENYSINERIV